MPHRPVCTIIGGANGSGKSTLYDRLDLPGRFLNADVVARLINPDRPEAASLAAGRHVLTALGKAVEEGDSFSYETTLSSYQSLQLMRMASRAGYEVGLVFVALNNVDLHVRRVAERVARGGHDIQEVVIRRRYATAMQRLPDAIRIADGSILLDNSASSGPQMLVRIRARNVEINHLDKTNPFHCRLAIAVARALEQE